MRTTITALATMSLLLGACGGDESATAPDSGPTSTSSTTAVESTTLPDGTPATASTAPPAETSSTSSTSTTPSTTTTTLPGGELTPCQSPEGYEIGYPSTWSTNTGEVVPTCGQFNPEPFDVRAGTDARHAAITVYIDQVPFHEVAAPDEDRDAERAATTIDGLQAVRLEYGATGEGLWPEGTPITYYAVDLSPGVDDGPGTLFVDTVGTQPFDYEDNRAILDRMARSLDVQMEGVDDAPGLVARYEGGGGGFTVEGELSGDRACLRIPPEGEQQCAPIPGAEGVEPLVLEDLGPVQAGITGEDVVAVRADLGDGDTSTLLPTPIGDTEVGGFSFAVGPESIERLTFLDVDGEEIGTAQPGS